MSIKALCWQVPCGETFHCELQWVARRLGTQRTQLRISASVVFDSHCWLRGTVNSKSKEVCCQPRDSNIHLWGTHPALACAGSSLL